MIVSKQISECSCLCVCVGSLFSPAKEFVMHNRKITTIQLSLRIKNDAMIESAVSKLENKSIQSYMRIEL